MAASHNVNAAKAFVSRFEGAEKTVAASRNVSALLNFRTHPLYGTGLPVPFVVTLSAQKSIAVGAIIDRPCRGFACTKIYRS